MLTSRQKWLSGSLHNGPRKVEVMRNVTSVPSTLTPDEVLDCLRDALLTNRNRMQARAAHSLGFVSMAITAGWHCLFIFIFLVLVIVSTMSASFFSFEYTKPLVDFPSTTWEYKDWAIVGDSDHCVAVAKYSMAIQNGSIYTLFFSRMFLKDYTGLYIRANQRLYKLLTDVATEGWKSFYTGKHAKRLEDDITRDLGWLAVGDLERYEPHWIEPIALRMHTDKILYAVPIPGGGALLGPILDLVNVTHGKLRFRAAKSVARTPIQTLHRLTELLKFTYAQKSSLGDILAIRTREQHNYTVQVLRSFYGAYDPKAALKTYAQYNASASIDYDDGGGAHLALRDRKGNALSVVMSLNWEFGCLYMSSCGFLMNNFMDSFSIPGGRNGLPMGENNANGMVKRPATTMTPVMITNAKGGALFAALGATGGLQGISAMGQFLECIGTFAVLDCAHNSVRVHPFPDEKTFSLTVGPKLGGYDPEKELKNFGHNIVHKPLTATLNGIVLTERNTWIAAGDVNYTDGGTRGEQYVHPVVKNVAQ
ncbi:hypothetical protein HPB51_009104 [Rhipicephalus microplus]|uniref:Gamma-glutamyltransferase n=1 Tax=Rhipicephalus microplus TaxID=6941 RepID=A0A9J6F0T8_RHIMP|nr:hypothetical protein HPB51_009104 [Rhipicephalus microplus]